MNREYSLKEKLAYKARCQENYNLLLQNLCEILVEINSCTWEDYNDAKHLLVEISQKIQNSELSYEQRESIWKQIQLGFETIKEFEYSLKSSLQEQTEKHKSEIEKIRNLFFSELNLPEVNFLEKKVVSSLPYEIVTPLAPMLDIYSNIFSENSEFRPQQIQYMSMCYEGVMNNRNVVIEGPTGLGKTRALFAAVLPKLILDKDSKLLYTTRTISQVNNVVREIKDILKDKKFASIDTTIHLGAGTIKSFVCDSFNSETRGINESCKECNDELRMKRFAPVKFEVEKINVIDLDFLKNIRKNNKCPLPYFRQKTSDARVVVFPFNYLFDSYWMSNFFKNDKNAKTTLVIDEAHNLLENLSSEPYLKLNCGYDENIDFFQRENRISNTYSLEHIVASTEKTFQRCPINISYENISIRKAFSFLFSLENEIVTALKGFTGDEYLISSNSNERTYIIAENNMVHFVNKISNKFLKNLERTKGIIEVYKNEIDSQNQRIKRGIEPSVYSFQQIIDALADITKTPYDFLITFNDKKQIQFYALHPKKRVEQVFKGFDSKIFTSATLSPPEDVAYLLGLKNSLCGKIPPIFKDENYKAFIIAGVNSSPKINIESTFTPKEGEVLEKLFETALTSAEGKNIGIFCSSNKVVLDTYSLLNKLKEKLDFKVLLYADAPQNDSNSLYLKRLENIVDDYEYICDLLHTEEYVCVNPNPQNKIDLFKKMGNINKTTLLMGVQGGRFSEGIDYIGNHMEMVIAVGLPYPNSASEIRINEIKKNYFYMQTGDKEFGEDLAYRQTAFRKLAQSLGRVHRQMSDRGILIIADERIAAIKNVSNEDNNRYEFLNIRNANEHLLLLQKPIRKYKNIVFWGQNEFEDRILKNYISSGFCSEENFISFEKMSNEIKEFYTQK